MSRPKAPPNKRAGSSLPTDGGSRSLWFEPPIDDQDRRPQLTANGWSPRRWRSSPRRRPGPDHARLARPPGRVPGALYHHVGNKQQLQDLVLDVLAEVDVHPTPPCLDRAAQDPGPPAASGPGGPSWGRRHPQDPRPAGPPFPGPGRGVPRAAAAAGFADREAGLAFFLLVDYTIGFAVGNPATSVNEQRVRDQAIRTQLHEFFRSLPPDRFPALVALGEHVWVDNRDERFTAGLQVLVDGLEHARRSPPAGARDGPPRPPEDVKPTADNQRDTQGG